MAKTLCRVAGGGKPLKGNAEAGDVLAGKTFSNKQSNALTGSMPNRGGHQSSTGVGGGSGSLWAWMPYGYYANYNNTGNAWIDITDDQAKTLANNAGVGYNSGYTNGKNDGYNSGKSDGYNATRTYTYKVDVSSAGPNNERKFWIAIYKEGKTIFSKTFEFGIYTTSGSFKG